MDQTPPPPPAVDYARLLVDRLPSMIAYWDADMRCRFANRAYERWFGVDPDALIGSSIVDLLGPALFALNEPYIRRALQGQAQEFERVFPGPDGVQRASLVVYLPHVVDGAVVGFCVQVTEVTRLKETEAALRAEIAARQRTAERLKHSEASLREAQRLGQIGSWRWDIASDTVTWSQELYRIHGRDPAAPAPRYAQLCSLYTAAGWARLRQAVEQTLQTGEPYATDIEYLKGDGSSGWIEARGEAVRDAQGKVVQLAGTGMDISERRALARLAVEAADAANREKSRLLSRVSHELRTPLNGILGFSQLIQLGAEPEATRRGWARLIEQSGSHMLQLVDDLLDLSAAESGQLKIELECIDIPALVERALASFAPQASQAGVTLVNAATGDAHHRAWGDRKRVDEVVNNVLSNAVKYNRPQGQVRLSADRVGATIELRVEDSGTGLTADQLAKLFVPFERLGAERSAIAGTGLGLVICRTLMDLMGGAVRISSQPGVGTTVVLVFAAADP